MTPEKLFHELLGLGLKWEVVESRFDRESGTVFLEIRETASLWESVHCPKDTGRVTCHDHTEVLAWRHLNVFQHRCEITCRLPRGKCKQCGHVFRVRPPWEGLSMHFTKEFEAFALLLMREMPVSRVADAIPAGGRSLCRGGFQQCVLWGVDEMSVRKGHEYVSVFADLARKRVIFATEGKAYQMRLVLQDIYQSPTATVAQHRFEVWCRWVRWVAGKQPKNVLRSMVKVAEMIEKHLLGILAHWKFIRTI